MPNPDTTHGQKLKHTFKYAEQRRTLWLNTHSKDEFGRHRGAVLYGMKVTAIGAKQLKVEPGAVYTPYGTRFFFEQFSAPSKPAFNLVDVSLPTDLFSPGVQATYPVVACVYLKFIIPDPKNSPQVEDVSEFDVANIEFGWRIVPHDRADVQPTNNLAPRDPILLDRVQPDAYEYENSAEIDFQKNSVQYFNPGSEAAAALQFGEIPLAYIVIGADPATGNVPTGLNDPGVEIVQCRNLFATLSDILGHDVFFGRHGKRVTGGLSSPRGSALSQGYSERIVGANTSVELMSPKFGTGEPDSTKITPVPDPAGEAFKADQDKASWRDSSWNTYRQPNFLRDGDGVVWALRRLDYILRLWIDRTGDQSLVAAIQDGQNTTPLEYTINAAQQGTGPGGEDEIIIDGMTDPSWAGATVTISQGNANDGVHTILSVSGNKIRLTAGQVAVATAALGSLTVSVVNPGSLTHVRPMMTLDGILQHFRGNDVAGQNISALSYPDDAAGAGSNPPNHAVKSGRAAHQPQTLENVLATGYGDSHLNAISALDLGVWHVLNDLFGRDFARRALRRTASWRSGSGLDTALLGPDAAAVSQALGHDDGPAGRLPIADTNADGYQRQENRPTVTGPVEDAYMSYEGMYDALGVLADRAQAAPQNWLRNAGFVIGDNSTSPGDLPLGWAGYHLASWQRLTLSADLQQYAMDVTFLPGGGTFKQAVDFGSTTLNDLLASCNIMHFAVAMKVVTGPIRVGARGLDAAGATVFEVVRAGITASPTYDNYSCAFKLASPLPTTVTKLLFFVDGPTGAQVQIIGASAGPGVPVSSSGYDRTFFEFLSRDGGLQSQMRGDLEMGNHDINDAHDVNANQDVNAGRDMNAGRDVNATRNVNATENVNSTLDTNVGQNLNVTGLSTLGGGADMNGSNIGDLATAVTDDQAPNWGQVKQYLIADEDATHADRINGSQNSAPNGSSPIETYTGSEYWATGHLIGQLLKVKGSDGLDWYIPGMRSPNHYCSCTCTCTCQCQCTCTCTGDYDCGSFMW